MRRCVFACLVVVLALSCLPTSQARDARPAAAPVVHCTPKRPCIHVFRVRSSTSGDSHVSWDSRVRFTRPNLAISVAYSPRLEFDQDIRSAPINDCGIHFWLNGRFNGVATRCGDGRLPLHVQIANVHQEPLRIVLSYWVPRLRPLGLAARPDR
jgi:hypothetical protein